jgi:hypothetical protein
MYGSVPSQVSKDPPFCQSASASVMADKIANLESLLNLGTRLADGLNASPLRRQPGKYKNPVLVSYFASPRRPGRPLASRRPGGSWAESGTVASNVRDALPDRIALAQFHLTRVCAKPSSSRRSCRRGLNGCGRCPILASGIHPRSALRGVRRRSVEQRYPPNLPDSYDPILRRPAVWAAASHRPAFLTPTVSRSNPNREPTESAGERANGLGRLYKRGADMRNFALQDGRPSLADNCMSPFWPVFGDPERLQTGKSHPYHYFDKDI